uniref:Uncharacterized protein n=1 Tax=Avena sativa TaxID=4498 RepID=A0ACD5YK37_AVESA
MADKENAAPVVAAGPRLTRAGAKRAAACSAGSSGGAKRKRVALSELPITVSNAAVFPRPSPQHPVKPTKPAKPDEEEGHLDGSRCESTSPPASAEEASSGGGGGDSQLCGSYASDIYTYLRTMEVEPARRPAADYIETVQTDVTANMRAILIDWLVEVSEEYKLVADTLYLTVSYVDRFLSANPLGRNRLQLLGVAAMLIAAKYEEISPPHVEDFCYITDNTYTRLELLTMESDILRLLDFEIGSPTIKTFLRRFTKSGPEEKKRSSLLLEFLGSYLAELSLLDYSCLRFLPSVIAASSIFLARLTIGPDTNPWSKEMQKLTGYRPSELKDCIIAIHELQLNRKGPCLPAIRDKYKQHRFKCVSTLLPPVEIPASYFQDITE